MNYDELLELTIDLAFQLQLCGAETYRVEESIVRLLEAYGAHGEAFAIPNCIIVSLETQDEPGFDGGAETGIAGGCA